jgi:hypothetical protein
MTAPSTGALARNPTSFDMLAPQGYLFQIKKLPNVNYFLQKVSVPDIALPAAIQATAFTDIPHPGNKLIFGDLNIDFKIDEDLANYTELYNWITSIGFMTDNSGYGVLAKKPSMSGDGVTSDVSILPTTGLKNANFEFTFQDAWPHYLGNFDFNTTEAGMPYLTCKAVFKYTIFTINSLTH